MGDRIVSDRTFTGRHRARGRRLPLIALIGCAVLLAGPAPDGALAEGSQPEKAELDLMLDATPAIVRHDYAKLPPIGPAGEMGVNGREGSSFFLSHQQYGDLYVRAGIARDDGALIEQGLQAFDYAFARQQPDGSFGSIQTEEYAFFVESVAHSISMLKATPYWSEHRDRLEGYVKRLELAARHMIEPAAWYEFKQRNADYTHSGYVVGTALALLARLTDEGVFKRRAGKAIELALSRQLADGVNPELGGYDVRYQMAGLTYAQRWLVYFPGDPLARPVREMNHAALRWMSGRIDVDGWIDWSGSTRTCVESNTNGRPKTPGYAYAIRGYAYWGARRSKDDLVATAERAQAYLDGRSGDSSLCDPKAPSDEGSAKTQSAGEERRAALRDRLE